MMKWLFERLCRIALLAILAAAVPASAQADEGLERVRAGDMRVASIGYRLSVGAAALCDLQEPGLGIQFHMLAQYPPESRDRVRAHFGFAGTVAVEGVVPDSPADRAGVKQDDTVAAIEGVVIPAGLPGEASNAEYIALYTAIAALPPEKPVEMTVIRAGERLRLRILPVPACRTRYELKLSDSFDARADGALVQITSRYLNETPLELLPALLAHELSHNILHHRVRLEAKGAGFGLLSGFGGNVGLFRQTEMQADILAVHLLARAGYDPAIAAGFRREIGPKQLAGMIRSRSHPPLKDRIAIAEAEAAKIAAAGGNAPLPAFYTARNDPLDGNWKPLLPEGR
ncbi:M48 family metalloprotease [Sphingomonas koreensis]